MKFPALGLMVVIILSCSLFLIVGLYLLANFSKLFRKWIRYEWLRKNLAVWLITLCFIIALTPTNPENDIAIAAGKWFKILYIEALDVTVMCVFVFNITLLVSRMRVVKNRSFRVRMTIILITIVISMMAVGAPTNYFLNGGNFQHVWLTVVFNFYTGCITGFIFVTMSYVELERDKELDEKELEVSRLRELKTKAELEALHSKINPHFLYNALNSIADLAITDGKKARKMTVALADLFRFSINYSNHNYSTIKEEVEMAEVYLQIEKIRFEDQLNYSVNIDEALNHYLVPRFVLQPLVENAVKHGLKATGRLTQILLEAKKEGEDGFVISIADNGPVFPEELSPGYGVRSTYDKMDLLFPDTYEIHFSNEPRKQVSVHIKKMIKNEPAV